MSILTRDKIWISADKQTYWQWDPGPQTLSLFINGQLAQQFLASVAGTPMVGGSGMIANFKNLIDGGDFTINPFQRGTVQAANIANTTTYGPDRWAFLGGGAGSAIQWSQVADTSVLGFSNSVRFQRASGNTDVTVVKMGQSLETADAVRVQGQQVTFSFWAASGANFSGTGGAITVQLVTGTGTNQSVATMFGGTWTGFTNVINTTQVITGTMTRYQFTATLANNVTQIGVIISWTPSGTAGANDYVQLNGLQLEAGSVASTFEHRDVQVELEICQRYFYQINEPAANVIIGAGMNTTAAIQIFYLALPVQMRIAPTVTVTAGTFKTNQAGTATNTTITAGTTHTVNAISINGNSAGTQGQATLLMGGGGTGLIAVSADL